MTRPTKLTVKSGARRISPYITKHTIDAAVTLVASTTTVLGPPIGQDIDESAAAVELDLTYGLTDDPTDERVLFAAGWYDRSTPPESREGILNSAIWAREVRWRSLGTPAQVIDVLDEMSREFDPMENRQPELRPSTFTGQGRYPAFQVLARGNTTSSVEAVGFVRIEHLVTQRFKRDNPQDWLGWVEEDTYDFDE